MTIQPVPGVHFPKPADVGALLHSLSLTLIPVLALLGVANQDQLFGWCALGFAVIDPLVSTLSTPDKVRAVVYGLGGITSAVLVGLGTLDESVAPTVVGAIAAALLSTMALFYTPTSTLAVEPQE